MQKILITGSSGFLGGYLLNAIEGKFAPISLNRNSGDFAIDLSDEELLKEVLSQINVTAVIHLAANGNVNYCEQFPDETYRINENASEVLSHWAAQNNIPFVFASTDQVFDGKKGNYTEEDNALPVNEYGKQKLLAEKLVLKNKGIVCRLPLMIGEKGGYEKALTENLLAGKEQHLFVDEWRSVLRADLAVKGLLQALNWSSGIYHLGGAERINRYELGLSIANKYPQIDKKLIKPSKQSDVVFTAQRPADVSLNSEKALSLGFWQK